LLQPPVVRITDRIHLVSRKDPAGPDIAHCDVFTVDCGSEAVLIDAGPGGDIYGPMKADLQQLGLWKNLRRCLITHIHEDHASGINQLRVDGIRVFASKPAADYTRNPGLMKAHYRDLPPVIDEVVEDGAVISVGDTSFQAVYTPGHTAGCVTWVADIGGLRCAFTGDLLFPNGTIGWPGSFDFDAKALKASLERLLTMRIEAILTGHQWNPTGPGSFWLKDANTHILETLRSGNEGRWR
jgi:metallo-beta-lactamase class B